MVRFQAIIQALLWVAMIGAVRAEEEVTYAGTIAAILQKNCAVCHHPGEVAPFSLLTYRDAAKRAKMLARVTASRYMPPFKAEPGAGVFRDICRLNDDEIAAIQKWVAAGAPEGDPARAPTPPIYSENWKLGPPDVIVNMPQAFTIPADGKDIYQCFVLPIDLPEDRYLVAYEYRPGNHTVVHHAIISQDNTGEAQRNDAADPAIGYRVHGTGTGLKAGFNGVLGVWTPGVVPNLLPDGVGLKLHKGSVIVLQNHYHPSGKTETDQSSVGLYFAKSPPTQLAHYTTLFQNNISIPAGDAHYAVNAQLEAKGDGRVIAITPHMHLIGQEMKVTATTPEGLVKPMIWIKQWDFNWQHQYFYARPFTVTKGTRIKLEASFDNSAANPNNPSNPPKTVKFGESTTDEMAGAILLVVDGAGSRPVAQVDSKTLERYVGRYTLDIPVTLDISQESGGLRALVDGKSDKVALIPESDTEFVCHAPEAKVTFRKDESGVFGYVIVMVDGKNHAGKRIK